MSNKAAERVGSAEFRGNLAKYLRRAKAGHAIIVQERGKSAYVLTRYEEPQAPAVFGCMRERTELAPDTVVNAGRDLWRSNKLP